MSVLEEHDKRCGRSPLTPSEVQECIEASERLLENSDMSAVVDGSRVMVWLAERIQAVYDALESPKAPVSARCAWCFRAMAGDLIGSPAADETWNALPKMNFDDSAAHSQVCEHNPLVQKIASAESENRALTAELEDLRGRKLGNADTWAEAASEATGMYDHMRKLHEAMKATIRSLLDTEVPAEELRKAIGELVR